MKELVLVLTISDTRTASTDKSGDYIKHALEQCDYHVKDIQRCKDDIGTIRSIMRQWLHHSQANIIIVSGGSGIARKDVTIEAIKPFFEKELSGFGELFRFLSYKEDVGSRAMLSRATAGIAHNKLIFLLPGSLGAVKLAMDRLIIPELQHILHEISKT